MRFFTTVFAAALATLVAAQSAQPNGPNPFSIPPSGLSFSAGTPATISWTPTTSGTVTILLRQGSSGSLDAGIPIAKNIPNSGSISWTPPSDIVKGNNYAFEIIDDTTPGNSNYTPQFSIDSSNTATKAATSAASTATTVASNTATTTSDATSATNSATDSATTSGTATTLATRTTSAATSDSSSTPTATPSAGAAAPVVKVSGGLVLLALGMLAL